jgi:plastocyanin
VKGARALVSGTLILAVICAVPAVSVAQDSGVPDTTTTTAAPDPGAPPSPEPPAPPAPTPPASAPDKGGDQTGGGDQAAPSTGNPSAATTTDASQPAAKARTASSTSVAMEDFLFSPASVTIHVGDIVTWHNSGKQPHTATADDGSFDTGTVVAGQSASHEFTRAGTFSYICTIHPNMKGTIRVLSASGSGGAGGGSGGSGGSAGSSSSGSSNSEASAVNSPAAAGDANTLPMTGMAVGALALVGLALLASGLIVKFSGRKSGQRQLSLF